MPDYRGPLTSATDVPSTRLPERLESVDALRLRLASPCPHELITMGSISLVISRTVRAGARPQSSETFVIGSAKSKKRGSQNPSPSGEGRLSGRAKARTGLELSNRNSNYFFSIALRSSARCVRSCSTCVGSSVRPVAAVVAGVPAGA